MALSVAQALKMEVLQQTRILAGAAGLDRRVEHINVLETFVEGDEFISLRHHLVLTTFAFAGDDSQRQAMIIELMARSGCSGVLFQEGVVAPLSSVVTNCAERLGLPLIEVPSTVLYHQIIEPLAGALLQEDAYRLHHALAVHRRLSQAALGPQPLASLLEAVAALLDRPVCVVGRIEGSLGASARWPQDAELAIDACLRLAELTRMGARWVLPLRGQDWLLVQALGPDDTLSPLDTTTLEEASGAVALEVYRRRAIDDVDRGQREELLQSLLTATPAAPSGPLHAAAARLGWSLAPRGRVARLMLGTDGADAGDDESARIARERLLRVLVDALATDEPAAPVAVFRGGVACVLRGRDNAAQGEDDVLARLRASVERLLHARPGFACRVGVGSSGDALADLRVSLAQAEKALAMSQTLPELGWFVEHDQVAMPSLLLELSERSDVRRWRDKVLGPLLGADAQRAELIRTLDVYLDAGDSHKQAARALDIHPKTLKYRLERIFALLGPTALCAEQRLPLHLAVKLTRLARAG